jgi:anti-anti-sigma regulatory factor
MYQVVTAGPLNQADTLLATEIHQGVLIAHVNVACIKDKQAAILRQSLLAVVKERRGRVALDLSSVKDFTCAWINVMLEVTRVCRKENWDLAIFGLKGAARDILRATHLDRKMTICFDRAEALGKLDIEPPTAWERLVRGLANHESNESLEPAPAQQGNSLAKAA